LTVVAGALIAALATWALRRRKGSEPVKPVA